MISRRRILTVTCASALSAGLGAIASGCGNKRRGGPPPTPPAGNSDPTPSGPAVEAPPHEPVEGRLVAGIYAAHPLGFSVRPAEPFAPRGTWQRSPRGVRVWVPEWLDGTAFHQDALAEVDATLPRREMDGPAVPGALPGPHDRWPARVVILDPGAFSFTWEGNEIPQPILAEGLIAAESWPEEDGTRSDVLWVSWRVRGVAYGVPPELGRAPLLPAYGHELERQHLRRFGP